MRLGVEPAPHARVHPPEARVQQAARLVQGEVRDEYLPHLRDEDEAFACHGERVGELDVAGEDQHQLVPSAEPVVGWHGPGEDGEKLRRAAAKDVEAEDVIPGGERLRIDGLGAGRRRAGPLGLVPHAARAQAQRLDRGQLRGAGVDGRLPWAGRAEVGVEQTAGIPARGQPGSDLVGGETGGLDTVTDLVRQGGILLQRLLQHLLPLGGRRELLGRGDLRRDDPCEQRQHDGLGGKLHWIGKLSPKSWRVKVLARGRQTLHCTTPWSRSSSSSRSSSRRCSRS